MWRARFDGPAVLELEGDDGGALRKTSSGGIFSPSVRASLAIFLLFSLSLRVALEISRGKGSDGEGGTMSTLMLKVEETGDSGLGRELL